MPGPPDQHRKIREAFRLSSDLQMDLICATHAHRILSAVREQPFRAGALRLCLFSVMLTLSKWVELYERYKDVIPSDVQSLAKGLHKDLVNRGIVKFRDNVVGHVWDKVVGRALTNDEIEQRLASVTRGDLPGFFRWVNDTNGSPGPSTVVQSVERIRDRIKEEHGLTDVDLHSPG